MRATTARVQRLCASLPARVVRSLRNRSLLIYHFWDEALRMKKDAAGPRVVPGISSAGGEPLSRSLLDATPPWAGTLPPPCAIPGMLTPAEERYYTWITKFHGGIGDVVEIGTWLGRSTWIICQGLLGNSAFRGRKLHCFDAFTWYASMDKWFEGRGHPVPRPGDSFEALFRENVQDIADHLEVRRARLPDLSWAGGPIEMLFVDCGSTLAVNEAWYGLLRGSFIPNRTLVVMQDWQNYKSVPYKFWTQTRTFTDTHADELDLLHEVRGGDIACFLFTDRDTSRWEGIG